MVFPWHKVSIPQELTGTFAEKTLQMQRAEIQYRAGILMRLGFSKADAVLRCRSGLDWEFELHGKPVVASEVENLVGEVFARAHLVKPRG